jgi:hypothetical protein
MYVGCVRNIKFPMKNMCVIIVYLLQNGQNKKCLKDTEYLNVTNNKSSNKMSHMVTISCLRSSNLTIILGDYGMGMTNR